MRKTDKAVQSIMLIQLSDLLTQIEHCIYPTSE